MKIYLKRLYKECKLFYILHRGKHENVDVNDSFYRCLITTRYNKVNVDLILHHNDMLNYKLLMTYISMLDNDKLNHLYNVLYVNKNIYEIGALEYKVRNIVLNEMEKRYESN